MATNFRENAFVRLIQLEKMSLVKGIRLWAIYKEKAK